VIGVLQDCTQSLLAERNLHASQDRLQTLGRLTLLGEVASGLAHELNQPLAAIATFAQAGERLLGLPEPRLERAQQVFKEVSQQALRAGDIIRRMRSLIKRRAAHFEVVAAGALIKEFLLMAEPMAYAQHVQLRTRVELGEQRVVVDAAQIHQALMILLQNALEAVKAVSDAHAQVTFSVSLEEQGLYIAVEDQGPGIDAETAAQIFRPFFSTKENGAGLGLISARNILEAHGSRLDFTNLPEHGGRFWFVLPIKSST
jgi:two-component system sensor kinase FixL